MCTSLLTEITLTDGTALLTPPGVSFQPGNPGNVEAGMLVIAGYWEQENGNKILTRLSATRRTEPRVPSKPTMRD
jgi:mannose-6-phosphate isomerase-like protein (cupin superfamily)